MIKSPKQISIEKKIITRLRDKPRSAAAFLFNDPEIQALQDYANVVSIRRLGYNDHGPVHMRKAALNALTMLDLLDDAGVKLDLEKENGGTIDDSRIAVLSSALLHDIGMTVSRDKHEFMSITLAIPIIDRLLDHIYNEELYKRVVIRSLIIEGIFGHMATQTIHSLEAGLVLIGDGCDMEKGRARIPYLISDKPKAGDIHKYASMAIKKVHFSKGEEKPIRIKIDMIQSVGFFQVEEVLFPKILRSPVKPYIELFAGIEKEKLLRYI